MIKGGVAFCKHILAVGLVYFTSCFDLYILFSSDSIFKNKMFVYSIYLQKIFLLTLWSQKIECFVSQ